MKRNYVSIYLPLIDDNGKRHTKNVCVAFGVKETLLFKKVKKLKSREIKKAIGVFSYQQLIKRSKKENRKPTELIKLMLSEKLISRRPEIKRTVSINPAKVKKWIGVLRKKKIDAEIAGFLEGMVDDEGGEK